MSTTLYQAIGQDYDDNWIVANVAVPDCLPYYDPSDRLDVPLYIKHELGLCLLEDYKVLTQEAAQ